jgi:coenzyme F420-reducing hydrogenase beta subunit
LKSGKNEDKPAVYAAKHNALSVRRESTSGGVFTALSDIVLECGGTVYGAAFDESFAVRHIRADSKEKRDAMRGSKYVQSELGDIFIAAEDDLNNNKTVLFTGTPCQTDALRVFLGQRGTEDKNLILCDFICFGVPSPKIWTEHTALLQKKRKSPLVSYNFRSKRIDWNRPVEQGTYKNGRTDFRSIYSQQQLRLYLRGYNLRPSCYVCPYTGPARPSDITLADYWGVKSHIEGFDDGFGVSLLLVSTCKGETLLRDAAGFLTLKESSLNDCMPHQDRLSGPTPRPAGRDEFWKTYNDGGYQAVLKKYSNHNMKGRLKWIAKRLLGRQY